MAKVTIKGARTKENLTTELPYHVYEAAKRRLKHLIAISDSLVVAFSGGKDSLVVLHLVKEIYDELGIKAPVDCIFRDEEVIPDSVIDFVNEYRQKDWIRMKWFCVPLKSQKYILGKTHDYIQWDPSREWLRQKPEWAVLGDGTVFDQYSMDEYVGSFYKGKVVVCTGIRTAESIFRFRAIINKINDTVIAGTKSKRVFMGRPIYDWQEKDIFKYFFEKGIKYCPIYDHQLFNGEAMRVSTPLHSESAKKLDKVRSRYPKFYEQLLAIFPEIALQEKYFHDIDVTAVMAAYPMTWDGIRLYINDHITDPKQHELAEQRLLEVMRMRDNPKVAPGYPVEYVFKKFVGGGFKRVILPCSQG